MEQTKPFFGFKKNKMQSSKSVGSDITNSSWSSAYFYFLFKVTHMCKFLQDLNHKCLFIWLLGFDNLESRISKT